MYVRGKISSISRDHVQSLDDMLKHFGGRLVHIVGNSATKEQKTIMSRRKLCLYTCMWCMLEKIGGKLIYLGVSVDTPPKAINSKKICI